MVYDMLTSGECCSIFDPQSAVTEHTKEMIDRFLALTSKTQSVLREIVVTSQKAKEYRRKIRNPNHSVKFLSRQHEIVTDIIMRDGAVLLTNYRKGQELSIKIRHPDFYSTQLSMFNALWDRL